MLLREKGHFAPRPVLEGVAENVALQVEKWANVQARTHWQLGDESIVDGADFYVGQRELGHLHLYAEAHVRLPRELRDLVIAAKLAKPFRWSEDFVVHRVRSAREAAETEWLFQLAYDHLRGTSLSELADRVTSKEPGALTPALAVH